MPKMLGISQELVICRYQNGITLLSPEHLLSQQPQNSPSKVLPIKSVAEFMQMPFSVFFFNNDFTVSDLNEAGCVSHRLSSKSDMLGHTVARISNNKQDIVKLEKNNNSVMSSHQLSIIKESLRLLDNQTIQTVSFKMPWYAENGGMRGVFGCAVNIDPKKVGSIAHRFVSISNIFGTFQLTVQNLLADFKINGEYFSVQEVEIIRGVLYGKTMREIGMQLHMSTKRVESDYMNIKIKIGVSTKKQLFERVITDFI